MSNRFPCPRCNSAQDFRSKTRKLESLPWRELYVRCSMCGFELKLGYTTDEIEKLRMRARGLSHRVRYEKSKHGWPSQTTLNHLIEVSDEIRMALIKLEADMEAVNGRR